MGGSAGREIRPLFLQSSLKLNSMRFELGALAGWACSSSAQGAPGPQGMGLPLGTFCLPPSPLREGLDHRNQSWALLSQRDNGGFPFTGSLWLVTGRGWHSSDRGFLQVFSEHLFISFTFLGGDARSHWKERAAVTSVSGAHSECILGPVVTPAACPFLCDPDGGGSGTAWHLSVGICWWP